MANAIAKKNILVEKGKSEKNSLIEKNTMSHHVSLSLIIYTVSIGIAVITNRTRFSFEC